MNKQKQNGSAHVIILIIVVLAIIGSLGFLFWNNFVRSNPDQKKQASTQKTKPNTPSSSPIKEDGNKGYLVLDDWKIKFKLPENIGEIRYYKKVAEPNDKGVIDYYEFSTKRVEELGGQCAESNGQGSVTRLASLDRTKMKREALASASFVNNNEPIDGYYYYASGGQAGCSDNGADIQKQDRDMIFEMLLHPIAK